ncbi:MAG: NADH-quinone oxidoreductase subunit C [Geobacteraceae bacterium]|nr:NADH-quinone oxidoreductase subunit C [Geobacteraceae bacterium]
MIDSSVGVTEENTAEVRPDEVITQSRVLKDEGFRFITMSSTELEDSVCVLYHFDKDLELRNLKVHVPKGSKISSVASAYSCAFLVENEIKEHFGVEFDGIPLDFQGMLYSDEEVQKTPFCNIGIKRA